MRQVQEDMIKRGIEMNVILYTTLIKGYTKKKNIEEAFSVYEVAKADLDHQPNIVLYNAILDCCVECREIDRMNTEFEYIREKAKEDEKNAQPDLITYSTVIKGNARKGNMTEVKKIYEFLKMRSDYILDEVIYNSILDGYSKVKFDKKDPDMKAKIGDNLKEAIKIYDEMKQNDISRSNVTFSILVKMFSRAGNFDQALKILDVMRNEGIRPGLIVYTCLIQTCIKMKDTKKAIQLFEDMKKDKVRLDHVIFNIIVNGCIFSGRIEQACIYSLEAFDRNIRLNNDVYKNLLKNILRNRKLKMHKKKHYGLLICQKLKDRNVNACHTERKSILALAYKQNSFNRNRNTNNKYDDDNNTGFSRKRNNGRNKKKQGNNNRWNRYNKY